MKIKGKPLNVKLGQKSISKQFMPRRLRCITVLKVNVVLMMQNQKKALIIAAKVAMDAAVAAKTAAVKVAAEQGVAVKAVLIHAVMVIT